MVALRAASRALSKVALLADCLVAQRAATSVPPTAVPKVALSVENSDWRSAEMRAAWTAAQTVRNLAALSVARLADSTVAPWAAP